MVGRRGVTVEDVVRIARISGVRVSPRDDVAFVTTRPSLDDNRNLSEVRVRRADGGEVYLSGEGDSNPRWSPSGLKLAFTSRRGAGKDEKGTGLFVWGLTGDPVRLAWFRYGISGVEWLGESSLVAGVVTTRSGYYDEDEDYIATDRLPLWYDSHGLVAGLYTQLALVDVESGRYTLVTREDNGVLGFTVCSQGDVYYYTVEDWRKPLIHVVKRLEGAGEGVEVLRGYHVSQLRCIGDRLYGLMHKFSIGMASHNRLWVIDEDKAECITCSFDRNIHSIAGDIDDMPLVLYADSGSTILAVADDNKIKDITRRGSIIHEAHANGSIIAYTMSTPTTPIEVYTYRSGSIEQVTNINNWLVKEASLTKPERVEVNVDGETVEGWVILPPDIKDGEKRPLILYIHGGPKAMYGYGFYSEMQLMTSQGYIVAYANPHGSDGYSEDFADIRGKYGEVDYKQLITFLDKVVNNYPVDTERLGVTGISYGGYMTNVMVVKSKKFKAAVSENGIADWISDYWASDIGYWFDPDQIGGTPLDNIEEYIKRSPAFQADNVETPLLIIHSMEDYRCFIDQALAMYVPLAMKGKKVKLVVFRKGSHGHSVLAEPRHRKKRLELKIEWFNKHLKGEKNGD